MKTTIRFISQPVLSLILLLTTVITAGAEEIRVAVAANFLAPATVVAAHYEKEKQVKVVLISSSTGKLFAQIRNGAPYHLFLAADNKRPQLLYEEGLAHSPFTYAVGSVVLWTGRQELAKYGDWQEALADSSVTRIALPQPATAPYGAMARQAMEESGLYAGIEKRLVYGQNVAQAFQYAVSGAVDLAFTALSFAYSETSKNGKYWIVTAAEPIIQQGCVLHGRKEGTAEDFARYLQSDRVAQMIAGFGYQRGQP